MNDDDDDDEAPSQHGSLRAGSSSGRGGFAQPRAAAGLILRGDLGGSLAAGIV